jgi:FAD dependent oxidoreductase TIGR03364
MWSRARRSRDIWAKLAPAAGIDILQTGMAMIARRTEAVAVLEAFLATEMGADCLLIDGADFAARGRDIPFAPCEAALLSPHELRVEARDALPKLLSWLAASWGVVILPPAHVHAIDPGSVVTASGTLRADQIFVCPGDQLAALYPALAADLGVSRCKLQMLRLADPGYRLPAPVMSDLGLTRYEGYAALPAVAPLNDRLAREQAPHLAAGVHLIVTQSADGTLVVGDSHVYGEALDPFQHVEVDALILDEFRQVLGEPPPVLERWIGTYAWSPDRNWVSREVAPGVHVTVVTCGAGMSTAFAIGEDVVRAALSAPFKDVV